MNTQHQVYVLMGFVEHLLYLNEISKMGILIEHIM